MSDVAAAVARGREAAEALMVDSCTVAGAPTRTWDEATGKWATAPGPPVYIGKCRAQVPNVAEESADAGEREWTVQAAIVSLPVVGSESVKVGSVVTITACQLDTQLAGVRYVVTAMHHKSHATARRLRCKEVTS